MAEDIIDVTPRTMDTDPDQASGRGIQEFAPTGVDIIRSGDELDLRSKTSDQLKYK
ncbi:MAG: hypothetical protein CM15mP98_06530 [Paracoccaceae bacterium]|nr:MAG: hypothetical protein CM15mP98_06530 [Paracoccaceae bacterium]